MKEEVIRDEDFEYCVLGLQRSGTNYLNALIKRNIKASIYYPRNRWTQQRGIWKHSMDLENKPDFEQVKDGSATNYGAAGGNHRLHWLKDMAAVYIHKHPYSWIESIIYNNVDIKRTYPEVMRTPKTHEDHIFEFLDLAQLVDLWQRHVTYWYSKKEEFGIYCLSYENLLSNTEYHLRNMAKRWDRECVSNNGYLEVDKVGQSEKFNDKLKQKYTTVQISILGYHHIEYINKNLSQSLMKDLGYSMIGNQDTWYNRKIGPYK